MSANRKAPTAEHPTVARPSFTAGARTLADRDPVLARLVGLAGLPRVPRSRDTPFAALVRAIVYQQLAGAAAAAIHRRLLAALDDNPTAEALLTLVFAREADAWRLVYDQNTVIPPPEPAPR